MQSVPDATGHLFLVSPLPTGFWIARDLEGPAHGVFREKKAALRFALFEGGHPNVVMLSPDGTEPRLRRTRG